MKVLYIAAECKPFAKMGGVGDVAAELPPALKALGVDIEVVIPYYGSMECERGYVEKRNVYPPYEVEFPNPAHPKGGTKQTVAIHQGHLGSVPVYFVENALYFSGASPDNPDPRYAKPYVHSDDIAFKDDIIRFSFFSEACLYLIRERDPEVVHINDWVLGYLFGRMKTERLSPKRVLTIHNIAYQGNIARTYIRGWHIEKSLLSDPGIEGSFAETDRPDVNALQLALKLADRVNTVSPNYAQEIIRPENRDDLFEGGKGLDAVIREFEQPKELLGILNGFVYPPEDEAPTFEELLEAKKSEKQALSTVFADPDAFLLGFVGRAVEQKVRLLMEQLDGYSVLEHILELPGVNVAVLGTGEPEYETFLRGITRSNYDCTIAYDKTKAGQISLGSDVFLMPSLFEPCGIAQMESMSHATPPLVRWTGGLVDTVEDYTGIDGTGFGFDGATREELLRSLVATVKKARDFWENEPGGFETIQRNGFVTRFSWEDSARRYVEDLYKPVLVEDS